MTLPEYVVTRRAHTQTSSLELSFEKGQIIRIISKTTHKKGYILGEFAPKNSSTMELKIERTGIFPEAHVAAFANFFHQSGTMPRTDPEKDELIRVSFRARVNLENCLDERSKLEKIRGRIDDFESILRDYV